MTLSATSISISPMLEPTQYEPELESRAGALAAAPAEVPLERRELVDTCRDRDHAGGERSRAAGTTRTRRRPTSVQTARYDPTKSGTARTRPLASRASQRPPEPRRAASSPPSSTPTAARKERERTEPGRNTHVHPVHLPDREDPRGGGEPERRRQRGVPEGRRLRHRAHQPTGSAATSAAFWRSSAWPGRRQLSARDADIGIGEDVLLPVLDAVEDGSRDGLGRGLRDRRSLGSSRCRRGRSGRRARARRARPEARAATATGRTRPPSRSSRPA